MTVPVLIATTPLEGMTEVPTSTSKITFLFSEAVRGAAAMVYLHKLDTGEVAASVAGSDLTYGFPTRVTASWNGLTLQPATAYYVVVEPGAFEQDTAPNDPYGGIAGTEEYRFYTAGYERDRSKDRTIGREFR